MLLWASGKRTFQSENPPLNCWRPLCLIQSVFSSFSTVCQEIDLPPVGCDFCGCDIYLHVHTVRDVRLFTSQWRCHAAKCHAENDWKKKKMTGCFTGVGAAKIRLAGSQTGGRDLRQEGDSRERRRGKDSGTRRRKTSGSASWHFWWKRFSSAHKQPNEWLKTGGKKMWTRRLPFSWRLFQSTDTFQLFCSLLLEPLQC